MKYFIILFTLFALWSMNGDTIYYSKPDFNCAFSNCSQEAQQMIIKQFNGKYPPEYYERNSKAWWNSYCTYFPYKCTY